MSRYLVLKFVRTVIFVGNLWRAWLHPPPWSQTSYRQTWDMIGCFLRLSGAVQGPVWNVGESGFEQTFSERLEKTDSERFQIAPPGVQINLFTLAHNFTDPKTASRESPSCVKKFLNAYLFIQTYRHDFIGQGTQHCLFSTPPLHVHTPGAVQKLSRAL